MGFPMRLAGEQLSPLFERELASTRMARRLAISQVIPLPVPRHRAISQNCWPRYAARSPALYPHGDRKAHGAPVEGKKAAPTIWSKPPCQRIRSREMPYSSSRSSRASSPEPMSTWSSPPGTSATAPSGRSAGCAVGSPPSASTDSSPSAESPSFFLAAVMRATAVTRSPSSTLIIFTPWVARPVWEISAVFTRRTVAPSVMMSSSC